VDSKKWFQIEGMMVDAVQVYLEKVAQGKISDLRLSYEDVQVMLRFYACGMVGVLFQHIDDRQLNEEKLLRQIERIIMGKMFPGD
jgi:hypothetical protein